MSTNRIAPPSVNSAGNCEVPPDVYTCVFVRGKLAESGKETRQINAEAEIIMPDLVTGSDGSQLSVAGRKFTVYMSVDEANKSFAAWHATFGKLGLLEDDLSVDIDKILEKINSKSLYFQAILTSKEDLFRKPPTAGKREGDPILVNGKPVSRGWRIDFLSAESIIGPVDVDPAIAAAVANRPY